MLSVITPTCDRPIAFALCERWMARQTIQPDEWIVADGGQEAAVCTMGQIHLQHPQPPGATNFAANLLNGLATARGEIIVFVEDDDAYQPDHLAQILAQLGPKALAAGDNRQRYYNVARRCYRLFANIGASLCQTAIRREVVPLLERTIRDCLAKGTYGIDTTFWRALPRERWSVGRTDTVVGIKGLPGRVGLGVGHRPDGAWTADPTLAMLRRWIGADADLYAGFASAL